MEDQNKDLKDEELQVDEGDELEKALDTALESLQKAAPEEEDEEYEEEDEPEEEETPAPPAKKKMSAKKSKEKEDENFEALAKSLPDALEGDEEASDVLDAMPFIKSLIDTLEEQMTALVKAIVNISDKVDGIEESLTKSQNLEVASAKVLKSLRKEVKEIGDLPNPPKSLINKNLKIMRKSDGNGNGKKSLEMKPVEVLDKISTLCKSGKISLEQATTAESRIQKGIPLSEGLMQLISSE